MSFHYSLQLERDDLCAILTVDGEMYDIFYRDYKEVMAEADMIMERMIHLIQLPEHEKGAWVWNIKRNGRQIEAYEVHSE